MSGDYYKIGLDVAELERNSRKAQNSFKNIGSTATVEGAKIDNMLRTVGRGVATYLTGRELIQFGKQIISVRGEFQQLSIAFETMLGSKEKADALMQQAVTFAAKTPFTLTDVTTNIKQLMAMGVETENVMDTMKSLGDVAAGVSVPISRVAINYGQVMTMGKLQGRELRDFAMAGIPLTDELAKNLGKAKEEIQGMISAGQVSASDVTKAFQTMSSEGGKFYNLMEKQNSSVTGQISNLQDRIEVMMNSIGEANEGLIYKGISGAANLVENYQEVLKVLKVLVVTYGSYKAVLIAVAATQGSMKLVENIRLISMFRKELGLATAAQQAFNRASKANIYVAAIAGIVGLITALSSFTKKIKTTQDRIDELNSSIEQIGKQQEINGLIDKYDSLKDKTELTKDEQKELNNTIKELSTIFPSVISEVDEYGNAVDLVREKLEKANEEHFKYLKNTTTQQLSENQKELNKLIAERAKLEKEVNTGSGKKLKLFGGGLSTQQYTYTQTYTLSESDKANNIKEIGELAGHIDDLRAKIKDGKEALSDLKSVSTDLSLKPYESLFKEVGEYTERQLYDTKTKLTGLLGAGFGKEAETKIKRQIDAIAAQLNLPTIKQQIKKTAKDLKAAQLKLSEMMAPDSKATEEKIKEQQDNIKNLQKTYDILTGTSGKENEKTIKAQSDLNQKKIDAQSALNKAIINLMNEGIEKQKALRKQAYNDQLADIDKQEQDYLVSLNKKNGKKSTGKGYATSLSDYVNNNTDDTESSDYYNNLQEQRLVADQQYVKDSEKIEQDAATNRQKIWQQATDAFLSDIEKEKQSINDKYDEWIKEATENGATQAEIDKLNEQRTKELVQVQSEAALKLSPLYQKAFGDIEKYGTKSLKSIKEKLTNLIDSAEQYTDSDGTIKFRVEFETGKLNEQGEEITKTVDLTQDEFTQWQEQLNQITNAVNSNNPFSALKTAWEDYKDAKQKYSDALDSEDESLISSAKSALSTKSGGLVAAAQAAAEYVRGLAASLEELGEVIGDENLENIGKFTETVLSFSLNPIENITNSYKLLTDGAKEYRDAVKDYTNELIDLQLEYNAVLNEQIRTQSEGTSIFYTDYVASIQDAAAAAQDALANLNESLDGSSLEDVLADLDIKTGVKKKKFLGITTGTSDVYEDLEDAWDKLDLSGDFSDLIDSAGNLNTELAQTLVDSGLLDEESQTALESLIEYQEQYDAAIEAINDSLESLVGTLSDDLYSALNDAWLDGTDSAEAFFDVVNEGLESLVSQLIYTTVFSELFDDLQDSLSNSFTTLSGDDLNEALTSIFSDFYTNAESLVEDYENAMDLASDAASSSGFDWSSISDSDRDADTGAFESMSQDSADALNGRFTAMQALMYETNNNVSTITGFTGEMKSSVDILRENSGAILEHLSGIHENTDNLPLMRQDISAMKTSISELYTKGVKIRN